MDLSKTLSSTAIATNVTETAVEPAPYLGAGLFPPRKRAGLDLTWIHGAKGLPVTLMPASFDSKAKLRDRIGMKKIETEMPFFREGFLLRERDRQELLRAQDKDDLYAQDVLSRVYDDTNQLIASANVVPERMIWQLLAPENGSPAIAIEANGVTYSYNYDPNGDFKRTNFLELTTATDKWSDAANADPLEDLRKMMDDREEETGSRPALAVMSRKTFNYLLKSEKVKGAFLAQSAAQSIYLVDSTVKSLVLELLGLNIVVYSKKYRDEAGVAKAFYPDDLVTLLPEGQIGSTNYGTTPEEADLMGKAQADVTIVNTGVAITTITHPHPVNVEILASEIVLPSFERMDEVAVLKVV